MIRILENFNAILTTLLINNIRDDGPDFNDLTAVVLKWLNAFMIPVVIIIGGLSIYKLIALAWKIAQTADRPDERRIAIMGLCWWGLGLVLCFAAPLIVNLVVPALMNAGGGGGYHPPTFFKR